uniref:ribonuclease H n=2 Tax=Iconisemion striatum TaxID=60296 RepID=A0A1A7XJR7_9TELE
MRKQEPNESVDAFVTALHALAEHCNYGSLHDELIRDRIVVGLADTRLSERMQMEKELDLEKAVYMARQSEEIKKQQTALRSDSSALQYNVNALEKPLETTKVWSKNKAPTFQQRTQKCKDALTLQCYKCGGPFRQKHQCPANDAKCRSCGKKGHYQRVCRQTKTVQCIEEDVGPEEQGFFLGTVSSGNRSWTVDVQIEGTPMTFKLDTGADVTVIATVDLDKVFSGKNTPVLQQPEKPLLGPGRTPLEVTGYLELQLCYGQRQTCEKVYIVKGLSMPLLGLPAITGLGLLQRVGSITSYPKLCSGLGVVQREYHIKLQPHVVPFSLKTPRRLPLPLMKKVKEELMRMEALGVITKVEEPTDWEKFVLPSVEQSLGMLAGAKVFSKLDANMGFWQIPLSKESAALTTFITPFGRFCFNCLPFGINSAPEHLQRIMSEVIEGLEGVVCHMDDVLVWGRCHEEHDARLHATLKRLEEAGITLNVGKCDFSRNKVIFLGHVITDSGISPDPRKTESITEMNIPATVGELRSFLGMVNQVGKFIPHLAKRDKALRDLSSKKNSWYWGGDQVKAFNDLKDAITSPPVLAAYV